MKTKTIIFNMAMAAVTMGGGYAAQAQSLDYQLTSIGGSWNYAETQWNDGANSSGPTTVNDSADVSNVNSILSSPYQYQPNYSTTPNGIDDFPQSDASLTFSLNGGELSKLSSLSIVSSRAYVPSTIVTLEYSINGGASWENYMTTTEGDLGWVEPTEDLVSTENVVIDLDGIVANAFRLSIDGNQTIIHSVTFDGATAQVAPEPSTWAMMIAGLLALVGCRVMRRRA